MAICLRWKIAIAWALLWLPAPAVAGSGALPPLVQDIGYCLFLSGSLAVVFNRLRIPTIAAFLVAGVLAGPVGLHLVTDPANIDIIAHLGLVFLLFLIGLELDVRKLLSTGRVILVTGALQFPLCAAFGFGVTKLLIWAGIGGSMLSGGDTPHIVPLYIGFVLGASSTLLVVKLFQESFQLDTTVGRICLGLLIFQDIWAIMLFAIQPTLNDPQLVPILFLFIGITLLTIPTVLVARYAMPVVFSWVARLPELTLVVALAWCFGIILLGANLDVVVKPVLGATPHLAVGSGMAALIAGAALASLRYSTDVVGKVGIVKDFFVTLFFVSLGMSIPMPEGFEILSLVVILVLLVLFARYLFFLPLLYLTGLDRRNAFVSSTRLAQVSEFSLVIAYTGVGLGHISATLNSAIIFAFVLTAIMTPSLFKWGDRLHDKLAPFLNLLGLKAPDTKSSDSDESYSLAVLGFHRVASSLLHEIKRTNPAILGRMLVVDSNVQLHSDIEEFGPTVRYGDLANAATLQHAGVDKADVVVVTIEDHILKGTSNRKIVEAVRLINPEATIIANAVELSESLHLYESGADFVYVPQVDSAQGILLAVNRALGGDLQHYRAELEDTYGPLHTRDEVMR